jgi:hypothetical protein
MAGDPVALISYPGVERPLDAEYTLTWGVQPSRAQVTVAPQDFTRIQGTGDLVLADNWHDPVTIPDCTAVDVAFLPGGAARLFLDDHRWRWAFPTISGHYNQPAEILLSVPPVAAPGQPRPNPPQPPPAPARGEEEFYPGTRRSAHELAKLCLKAMGETSYTLGGLDEAATPRVDWEEANAAQALEAMCHELGCVVVWRPDGRNGAVRVVKRGEGEPPAGGVVLQDAPSLAATPRPEAIRLFSAPIQYQVRLLLEPVGYDFDHSIKPIDQLSYKPTNGWVDGGPPRWGGVFSRQNLPAGRTGYDAVALAQRCVYLMYRIRADWQPDQVDKFDPTKKGPKRLRIPPDSKDPRHDIEKIEQIHLLDKRNLICRDDLGRPMTQPAVCYGRHTNPEAGTIAQDIAKFFDQTTKMTEVLIPFHIDPVHQLVVFGARCLAIRDNRYVAPEIVLETCVIVLDKDTRAPVRAIFDLPIRNGTKDAIARFIQDDVVYRSTAQYDADHRVTKVVGNDGDTRARADHYLKGQARRYDLTGAERRVGAGVMPWYTDGLVMQVTWTLNPEGRQFQTVASLNTEHDLYVPGWPLRQVELKTKRDAEQGRRESDAGAVWRLKAGVVDPFHPNGSRGMRNF